MGRTRMARRVTECVVTLAVITLAPAVLVFGELARRYFMHRLPRALPAGSVRSGRSPATAIRLSRRRRLLFRFFNNPVFIALTAPARWVIGRWRSRPGGRGGRGGAGPWPPSAGDREPRRPGPDLPAGSIAFPGPRHP